VAEGYDGRLAALWLLEILASDTQQDDGHDVVATLGEEALVRRRWHVISARPCRSGTLELAGTSFDVVHRDAGGAVRFTLLDALGAA
jgi:hypothetical protein